MTGYSFLLDCISGNRTAVTPPTPPGPKGSNGNGCCRVSGSQKGANSFAPFLFFRRSRFLRTCPGPAMPGGRPSLHLTASQRRRGISAPLPFRRRNVLSRLPLSSPSCPFRLRPRTPPDPADDSLFLLLRPAARHRPRRPCLLKDKGEGSFPPCLRLFPFLGKIEKRRPAQALCSRSPL